MSCQSCFRMKGIYLVTHLNGIGTLQVLFLIPLRIKHSDPIMQTMLSKSKYLMIPTNVASSGPTRKELMYTCIQTCCLSARSKNYVLIQTQDILLFLFFLLLSLIPKMEAKFLFHRCFCRGIFPISSLARSCSDHQATGEADSNITITGSINQP